MEILNVILVVAIVCIISGIYKSYSDELFWNNFVLQNFPFKWRGKTFWYSRSCAVSLYTFCKDSTNNWCVLANKRGEGTPDFQGFWNAPCGYLDFNESGEQGAIRETREETGIEVPLENVFFDKVNTSPTENRQNVSLRYYAVLNGTTDDYKFNTSGMEKNEVGDVAWVKIDDIDNFQWAFNHDKNIKRIFDEHKIKNI